MNNRLPSELFVPAEAHTWCPDCYEGNTLRDEFRSLDFLQKAFSVYYASDEFLDFSMIAGRQLPKKSWRTMSDLIWSDPCVAATLRENPHLRRLFTVPLRGVPEIACER